MCGRFAIVSPSGFLEAHFSLQLEFDFLPQYNIAPTENILALASVNNTPCLEIFRWGLIPSWVKNENKKQIIINARSETVDVLPSFKREFLHHRCLILASGFYEWTKVGSERIPYYFHFRDNQVFAIAGIWSPERIEREGIDTCAMLTLSADEIVQPFHNRMPVIVSKENYESWLASKTDISKLKHIINSPYATPLTYYRVTQKVNSAFYKGRDCIQPIHS